MTSKCWKMQYISVFINKCSMKRINLKSKTSDFSRCSVQDGLTAVVANLFMKYKNTLPFSTICHPWGGEGGWNPSSSNQARYAPSQWEMSLQCNDISHWLGAYLDWSLHVSCIVNTMVADVQQPMVLVLLTQNIKVSATDGLISLARCKISLTCTMSVLKWFNQSQHKEQGAEMKWPCLASWTEIQGYFLLILMWSEQK